MSRDHNLPHQSSVFCGMRIALVHPGYEGIVYDTLSIPLGLAVLSSYLKSHGIEVDCYDLAISPGDEAKLRTRSYDAIGVQLHSFDGLPAGYQLMRMVRLCHPQTPILVGGHVALSQWQQILTEHLADYVVVGEGEIAVLELLRWLKSASSRASTTCAEIPGVATLVGGEPRLTNRATEIDDLDQLPFPDWSAFPWQKYPQWSVVTARGCNYRCTFCTGPAMWLTRLRMRSVDSVVGEIAKLRECYNVRKVFFLDDSFTASRPRLVGIMNTLIKERYLDEWACLARPDEVDQELLDLMALAGCGGISYGIETANDKTLDRIGKGFNSEQGRQAIRMTLRSGIRVRTSFIFGLPEEGPTEIRNTIRFMLAEQPNEIQVYPLIVYPGSAMASRMLDCGLRRTKLKPEEWKKNAFEPSVESESLSRAQAVALAEECVQSLKAVGYKWIPGDSPPRKAGFEKVVMTEFSPIQALDSEGV